MTADAERHVLFVVPQGIDDPRLVSGGNVYDRHIRDGLARVGWSVTVVEATDAVGAASALRSVPDGTLVMIDGLVACRAPDALVAEAGRLRIVVLAHMVRAAFADATDADLDAERRALSSARRVLVTSRWSAGEMVTRELVDEDRITVAPPGVQPIDEVHRPRGDRDLLCVGVIAPHKGQDTLVDALARVREQDWSCEIVGSVEQFPDFAASVAHRARQLAGRVRMPGVLAGDELAETYRRSALLVAPSRAESAGMAIADARAWGMPVIAARTGGIPETVAGGGAVLIKPDDPAALAEALQTWMTDPELRSRLRREAATVRGHLPAWDRTVSAIAAALEAT